MIDQNGPKPARSPRVLVLLDYYLPGFKAGGPIRTLSNLVEQLGDEVDFWIWTRDRDDGDIAPYPDLVFNTWHHTDKAHVYYATPDHQSRKHIAHQLEQIRPDIVYLNSFHSTFTVLYLLHRRLTGLKTATIIAPRGELAPGALAIKSTKKRLYHFVARLGGLYRSLTWQASSEREKAELKAGWPSAEHILIAPNLPTQHPTDSLHDHPPKTAGSARMIYVARVAPIKNLLLLLKALSTVSGEVILTVCGPADDQAYHAQCIKATADMPENIQVKFMGAVPHHQITKQLVDHHFFTLPTKGENFGHAIFEAMSAGCPVVISDKTQWRDLEHVGGGWDLSLEAVDTWSSVLQRCVDMQQSEYTNLSANAARFTRTWINNNELLEVNRALFHNVDSNSTR